MRSKIERRQAKLLAAKRVVKNAQDPRRGIDGDSRLFVRMPRADGALKEMERNGETQNRRSGSRAGVNRCWGRSSVKGSVERIYLRQHHQHHDDEYGKSQQEQPGRGNCPPRHAAMFRQAPAEVNPKKTPQKRPWWAESRAWPASWTGTPAISPHRGSVRCLVLSHCTRIFSSVCPSFASDSRPESEADDSRISGSY